jgi:hypothetical protein
MERSHLHYKKLLEKPLDDFWRSIKIISILGAFLLLLAQTNKVRFLLPPFPMLHHFDNRCR